jgi:hypothetical protein
LSRFQSSLKKGASAATVLAILTPRKRLWAQTGQSFLSVKVGGSIAIAGAAAIVMCFGLTPISKETKVLSKRGVATQTSQKRRSVPAQTLQSPSMAKAPASADVLPTSKIVDELRVPQLPDAQVILGRGKTRKRRNTRMAQTKASLNVSKETTTPLTGVVKEHGPAKVRRGSVIEGPSISLGHYQNEI